MSPVALALLGAACATLLARRALGRHQMDATPLLFLKVPFNALAFALRRRAAYRRGVPEHPNEPKDTLFEGSVEADALAGHERALRRRYDLGALWARSSCHVYRENLYVLDVLDTHATAFAAHLPESVRALDIGSQDFRYAFALERWLRHAASDQPRAVSLVGIELDGHPVYEDLHARADHADAYAAETGNPEVRYVVGDALEVPLGRAQVVTMFFPFVLSYALVRWGLPLSRFAPERLLRMVVVALDEHGLLIVLNHTHEERDAQHRLLADVAELEIVGQWPVSGRMLAYGEDVPERTLTVARKRAARSTRSSPSS